MFSLPQLSNDQGSQPTARGENAVGLHLSDDEPPIPVGPGDPPFAVPTQPRPPTSTLPHNTEPTVSGLLSRPKAEPRRSQSHRQSHCQEDTALTLLSRRHSKKRRSGRKARNRTRTGTTVTVGYRHQQQHDGFFVVASITAISCFESIFFYGILCCFESIF